LGGCFDGLLVRVTGDVLVDETSNFPRFSIRCLSATPDGSLWIGYAGFGAGRLRAGHITRFSTEQGLPNDYVSQIQADGNGGIWFAGNQGIFQVREQEFDDVAAGRAARVQTGALRAQPGTAKPAGQLLTFIRILCGRRTDIYIFPCLLAWRKSIRTAPAEPPAVGRDDERVMVMTGRLRLPR